MNQEKKELIKLSIPIFIMAPMIIIGFYILFLINQIQIIFLLGGIGIIFLVVSLYIFGVFDRKEIEKK